MVVREVRFLPMLLTKFTTMNDNNILRLLRVINMTKALRTIHPNDMDTVTLKKWHQMHSVFNKLAN